MYFRKTLFTLPHSMSTLSIGIVVTVLLSAVDLSHQQSFLLGCETDRSVTSVDTGNRTLPLFFMDGWTFPRSVEGVSRYNSDCKPSLTADGRQLYFISTPNNGPPYGGESYGMGFNIYVARWNGAEWDSITNLGPNVNPASYGCISADGQTLYFTRGQSIWVSVFDGTEWTESVELPYPVNDSTANDRAPFITADGRELYFASNRMEGYGNYDIWVVRWNGSGWDSLTNLGPTVNTEASETHPALSPDGQTLYFSDFSGSRSVWKFGDADLYVSHWLGSSWSSPSIVGSPVNSDLPLCSSFPTADGRLLVGSGVSEGGFGEEDIWELEPVSFPGERRYDQSPSASDWMKVGVLEGAWNIHCLIEGWDRTVYAGTSPNGDVFRTEDGGENWEPTGDLTGAVIVYSLIEASDHSLYAGTYPGGDVFRSTDGGDSWIGTADMPYVTAVRTLVEASDGSIFAGTSPDSAGWGRIYRSTDKGLSWRRTGPIQGVNGGIHTIVEGTDGAIFAGGRVSGDRIFVSPNGGVSWADINLPWDDARITIGSIEVLTFTSDGTFWAGGWAHGPQGILAHSTDYGATWDTTASIWNGEVRVARIYDLVEESDGSLLIGYHPGPDSIVMRSTDSGTVWESAGTLPGARELLCFLKTSDGTILAGTSADGGIYRKSSSGIDYDDDTGMISRVGRLDQNYPNPFNPLTTIRYTVPEPGSTNPRYEPSSVLVETRLTIYNVHGRAVRVLVDELGPPGTYTAVWDGRDDSGQVTQSGVYFYRLETGNGSVVRKMLLLR